MRGALVGLFLAVFGAAFANGRPHPEVDCVAAPYTAWSLVRDGSFDIGRYGELAPFEPLQTRRVRGDQWVSIRPPGAAVSALPVVAPLALARERPLSSLAMLQLGKAVGAGCVAIAACLFLLVCRRIAPGGAWPATILFAFGTCLFSVASQALWMHGPATMWLCCALYLLTGERGNARAVLFAAGTALGLAVLARPSTALFAAAAVAALVFDRRTRAAAWTALGGVLPAALLVHYNWHYFGSLTLGGYGDIAWGEPQPLVSLGGLLIAPSRGVFVYSPALLLAVVGAVRLVRRSEDLPGAWPRPLLLAWALAAVATVGLYCRWGDWRGGWCFGPRYLCEVMPIACLLFGVAYQALRTRLARAVAIGLVAVSVAIHFVGVHGHGGYAAWNQRHDRPDAGACLFELEDTQIEAHARSFAYEMQKKLR